jgi:O-antigen/teichoic acid export membrane protein
MTSILTIRRAVASRPARNIATLMSSTIAAQVLTFAATPLLTRLYSQEAYGAAGVYTAVLNTASVLVTGKYELAIPLEKDDRSAAEVLLLCLVVAFAVSLALFVPLVLFPSAIAAALHSPALKPWLLVLPLSLFSWGAYQAFTFWCNRHGDFSSLAASRFLRSAANVTSSLSLARPLAGAGGLIIGSLIGQIAAVSWIAQSTFRKTRLGVSQFSCQGFRAHAHFHRDLPLFHASTSLIDNYALAAPLLFMNWFGGTASAGALNLVMLVLGTPVSIVSESVGQVMFQHVAEARRSGTAIKHFVGRNAALLSVLVIPGVCVLALIAPRLFEILFGHGWRLAGEYARWLGVAYGFRLVVSPLSLLLPAAGRVRWGAAWKILYGISTTAALLVGRKGPRDLILALVLNDALMYSLYFWIIARAAGDPSNYDRTTLA